MAAVLMDGKTLAKEIKERVRREVESMEKKPGLAVILVGENPATRVYVDGKTWSARSVSGEPIAVGTMVRVKRMEGVRLFVEEWKEEA